MVTRSSPAAAFRGVSSAAIAQEASVAPATVYQAFGTKLKASDLGQGDRIIHRIEQADKKFDHYKPAEVLLREQTTLLPDLDEATLDNFEQLIIRINATLD